MNAHTITTRALRADDLGRLVAWRNDPVVTRHLASASVTLEQVSTWFSSLRHDAGERAWAIHFDDAMVGYAVINAVDTINATCEAGILLGEISCWGRGIGTEVARRLALSAFGDLGMHRVLAVTSAHNPAAIRCFESAGFREEGRLREARREGDVWVDLVLLSLLEQEWRSMHQPGGALELIDTKGHVWHFERDAAR